MDFKYHGAAVSPWTELDGVPYFLLSKSANGDDADTWDDWGGGREDRDNGNPLKTAVRECTEESMGLLGAHSSVKYLVSPTARTRPLLDTEREFATFFSWIPYDILKMPDFYVQRTRLQNRFLRTTDPEEQKTLRSMLEKKEIGWVSQDELQRVVVEAVRDPMNGRLVTPLIAKALVIDSNGRLDPQFITMRPFFIDRLTRLLPIGTFWG